MEQICPRVHGIAAEKHGRVFSQTIDLQPWAAKPKTLAVDTMHEDTTVPQQPLLRLLVADERRLATICCLATDAAMVENERLSQISS